MFIIDLCVCVTKEPLTMRKKKKKNGEWEWLTISDHTYACLYGVALKRLFEPTRERKKERKKHNLFGIPDDYCFDGQFIHTFPCELLFMTGEESSSRVEVKITTQVARGESLFYISPTYKRRTCNQDSHAVVVFSSTFYIFCLIFCVCANYKGLPCGLDGLLRCSGSLWWPSDRERCLNWPNGSKCWKQNETRIFFFFF